MIQYDPIGKKYTFHFPHLYKYYTALCAIGNIMQGDERAFFLDGVFIFARFPDEAKHPRRINGFINPKKAQHFAFEPIAEYKSGNPSIIDLRKNPVFGRYHEMIDQAIRAEMDVVNTNTGLEGKVSK